MMEEFAIREGRSGDFIEDRNGERILLIALICGRHLKGEIRLSIRYTSGIPRAKSGKFRAVVRADESLPEV